MASWHAFCTIKDYRNNFNTKVRVVVLGPSKVKRVKGLVSNYIKTN